MQRRDRRTIDPSTFRQEMAELYGPRPDFRAAAKELGVPKSTLHRLWRGGRSISAKNLGALAGRLGVPAAWLEHGEGKTAGGEAPAYAFKSETGEVRLDVAHFFPGSEQGGHTYPGAKGRRALARVYEACKTLGRAHSDPATPWRPTAGLELPFPPSPVRRHIQSALRLVAFEWRRELGALPKKDREDLLSAWYHVWATTLEAATRVPEVRVPAPHVGWRVDQMQPRRSAVPSPNLNELGALLRKKPGSFDALLDAELNREGQPRKRAVRLFLTAERRRRGGSRPAVVAELRDILRNLG
jgi:hypothetical protein